MIFVVGRILFLFLCPTVYSKSLIYIIGNGTQIEKFPLNDIAILSCTCTLRSLFLTVKNKYELSNVQIYSIPRWLNTVSSTFLYRFSVLLF
ncbi:unnamed protein product [Rotaria magnacalcarata]